MGRRDIQVRQMGGRAQRTTKDGVKPNKSDCFRWDLREKNQNKQKHNNSMDIMDVQAKRTLYNT